MVAGLVDGKAAGILPHAVPAVEIARTVLDVDVPVQVDMGDPADLAVQDQFADQAALRTVAVIEGAGHLALGLLLRLADADRVLPVGGHRFFGDDVEILFEGFDDVMRVEAVFADHEHGIRLGLFDHFVVFVRQISRDIFGLRHILAADGETLRVDVEHPDQLGLFRKGGVDRSDPHGDRAAGNPADDITTFHFVFSLVGLMKKRTPSLAYPREKNILPPRRKVKCETTFSPETAGAVAVTPFRDRAGRSRWRCCGRSFSTRLPAGGRNRASRRARVSPENWRRRCCCRSRCRKRAGPGIP